MIIYTVRNSFKVKHIFFKSINIFGNILHKPLENNYFNDSIHLGNIFRMH